MGIFRKKESFDIKCGDREIKNMIDSYCQEKPDWYGYYEQKTAFLVKYGIKYLEELKKWLDIEYSNHHSDDSCDIPDYKTFMSLEKNMLENPNDYQNKTVCVEGYIAYGAFDTVTIYPVPCRSEIEKQSAYILADFHSFYVINLIGKEAEKINNTLNNGAHIRVYGLTNPRTDWDNIPVIIQKYEVLK